MYAASRASIKTEGPIFRSKNSNSIFSVAENQMWKPGVCMPKRSAPDDAQTTTTPLTTASSSRCQTAKHQIVDEWEILDETLDDRHHYFTHHLTGSSDTLNQSNIFSKTEKKDGTSPKAIRAGRSNSAGYNTTSDKIPDKGLPDTKENQKTNGEQKGAPFSMEEEKDDAPFTTLESIIKAAKRLSGSQISSTRSSVTRLASIDYSSSLSKNRRGPFPERMSSLNDSRDEEQKSSEASLINVKGDVQDDNEHSTSDYGDSGSEQIDSLDEGTRNVSRYSRLARGFTWTSTDSSQVDFVPLRRVRRLPPPQKSFLGSLDSEASM